MTSPRYDPNRPLLRSALSPFSNRPFRTLLLAVLGGLSSGVVAQTVTRGEAAAVALRTEADTLAATDAADGDILGYAVALSGDRALVGAAAGDASGAAYVFRQSAFGWTEEAKLVPADAAPGDYFGVSVALSGDRALIGGYHHDDQRGAAYVFVRTAAGWVQEAKLPTVGDPGDNLGVSVALSGDRALVGANKRHDARGAAYVFVRTANGWVLESELEAPEGTAGDAFGWSVAIDGDRAVVGAYGRDGGRGAAYVFDRAASTWTHHATLLAPDGGAGDNLGVSVALDGDQVVAGAPFHDGQATDGGAAYAFDLANDDVRLAGKLTDPGGQAGDYFGWSVALRDTRALVGSRFDDDEARGEAGKNVGSALLYTHVGDGWTAESKLLRPTATRSAGAGVSVALSDRHALVGAPYHVRSRGTVHVFTVAAPSVAAEGDGGLDLGLAVAPNPVAGRARATFGLPQAGPVRASVVDLLGREVAVLADAPHAAGRHDLDLDATPLPAGVYVLRVVTEQGAGVLRFTVAR